MAILCPYCRHSMTVKDAKPGKYKPKCAKCGKRFALTIAVDATQQPVVEALTEELVPGPSGAATVADATLPPSAPAPPRPRASSAKTQIGGTDATLAPDPHSIGGAAVTTPDRATSGTRFAGAAQATRADAPSASNSGGPLPQIHGYKVIRELGRGAMGSVYLAKQLSLDREVAIKTIQAQWADNPTFIARFTREAYAAAQLTHHNVVQIYDLGVDGDTHFFSMEYVRGTSLDHVVKQAGKLDVEAAVGYVLQAARGLEFAHNHGMVHRDVKPANLMLNEHGVVKVADLGLVKTPQFVEDESSPAPAGGAALGKSASGGSSLAAATADVTLANMAMGTPAYMAPEQSENASGVDHRADIYSLGCTLYVLLTGRPPFEGASALEVMSKHKTEPVVRPEAIVKRVPPELSEITLKMVAKRPEDRYQNLGQVIKSLEGFLGIQSAGTFSPREEQVQTLEVSASKFNGAGMAKLRGPIVLGFIGMIAVLFLAGLAWGSWGFSAGALAMAAAAVVAYFIVSGIRERTFLLGKFREYLATLRWTDWLTWIISGLLLLVILLVLGWLWLAIGMAVVGLLLGLAYHFVIDGRAAAQRREPLEQVEQLLKSLRLKGVDETALQHFIAKYSGQQWEEFFEALFGYEAKLAARRQWGRSDKGRDRPKFRGWRDPLVRWIDSRVLAYRELRDRKLLQKIEEKNLQAQGVDLIAARKQSQHMADALLDEAADARAAAVAAAAAPPASQTIIDPKLEAAKKRSRVKTMLADAKKGAYQAKRRRAVGTLMSPLTFALGGKVRFLLGCMLLAGCGLWAKQNGLISREKVEQVSSAVTTSVQQGSATNLASGAQALTANELKPLGIPVVGPFVSSFNAGIAGLVLIVLGLFRGWKMSLFALPAAAIMVLGPSFGIPAILSFPGIHLGSLAIGLVVAAIGFFFGRTYEE